MENLIQSVAGKVGLDEGVAKAAIGEIFKFLKAQSAGSAYDFDEILSKLPGAADLINATMQSSSGVGGGDSSSQRGAEKEQSGAPSVGGVSAAGGGPTSSGIVGLVFTLLKMFGVMAILKQLLSTVFGDSAVKMLENIEGGAELSSILSQLGISQEQGVSVVRMIYDYMKDKLDPEMIDKLTKRIPALQTFLAESKKDE